VKCLSTEYENAHALLNWQCGDCNHIWKASYANINYKKWCPKCGEKKKGNRKYSLEIAQEFARSNDGELLSEIYIDCHSKMEWRCNKCNKIKIASFIYVKRGHWCKCDKKKINNFIEKLNID
jgi:hypothetical protein